MRGIDFGRLNELAARHVPNDSWRLVGEVEITGEVTCDREWWTARANYRSEGRASRYMVVYGSSPEAAAHRALEVFAQPWSGWRIHGSIEDDARRPEVNRHRGWDVERGSSYITLSKGGYRIHLSRYGSGASLYGPHGPKKSSPRLVHRHVFVDSDEGMIETAVAAIDAKPWAEVFDRNPLDPIPATIEEGDRFLRPSMMHEQDAGERGLKLVPDGDTFVVRKR